MKTPNKKVTSARAGARSRSARSAPGTPRKKPSGAQNRKRAKARKAELDAKDGALALPPEVLERIGLPPEDSTKVLPWVNRALVELTHLMLQQVGLNVFDRARHLREMAKALGMIYPRAEVEELLRRLLETLGAKKDKSGGTEPLEPGAWSRPVVGTDVPVDRSI